MVPGQLLARLLPARHNLALVLHRQNKAAEALSVVDECLSAEPRHTGHRNLKAAILGTIGEYEAALQLYRDVLNEYPDQAKVWMSFGHALKTAGHEEDGIDAYRRSIELMPRLGEAYWSLANLKTFRFAPQDVGAMRAALSAAGLDPQERLHFHFALGKALEDRGQFEESFEHYAEGNRLRRLDLRYDAEEHHHKLARSHDLFTAEFLHERAGAGCPAPDPIFIIGLPRSGSTLLEQILASHSQVEGTMELPNLLTLVREFDQADRAGDAYPESVARATSERLRELGARYLDETRIFRSDRPRFIDKMPNNFSHVGLIHAILPEAFIIDVRRHPLDACWSAYKQYFAQGQSFTYDLEDLGRYYRAYLALMDHWDAVLPGRVLQVSYEALVADTEGQVRRLLAHCGLAFEAACLRFHDNKRAVRTASSEQVRMPIYRSGIGQWRRVAAQLEPLRRVLGDSLERFERS